MMDDDVNGVIKIAIASDHAGFELKSSVMEWIRQLPCKIKDFGTYSKESVDYPDFVHPVASAIRRGEYGMGILVCGSGQGVAITANKYPGIRAALCWNPEIAVLSRQHNDANVLCLPARFLEKERMNEILEQFFSTAFEGGRHQKRIDKIPAQLI